MSIWQTALLGAMPQRRVFVSYHHANDQWAYDQLTQIFSTAFGVFTDRSLDDLIDSNNPDYVYRRLREDFIQGSSVTIVLVGPETFKRKYIDWELYATLDMQHGLLGLALHTASRNVQGQLLVPGRLHDNIQSGFAVWTGWPNSAEELKVSIELAAERARSQRTLIRNSRTLMARNSP